MEESFLNTLETKFGTFFNWEKSWNKNALFSCFIRSVMVWSEAKDYIMLKEVAAEGVFDSNPGSRDRGTQIHDGTKIKLRKCLILK